MMTSVISIVLLMGAPFAFAQSGGLLSKHPQDKGFAFRTKEFTRGYIIGWALN